MQYVYHYESPLGGITTVSEGEALTGLWFDGQRYFGAGLAETPKKKDLPVFSQVKNWLDIYFAGEKPDFTPPLFIRASAFQCAVYTVLLTIPYGHTMSYGQVADRIYAQGYTLRPSARAVGGAVGHNPISLIIPCHRVIGADGSLTGYAGGIERKLRLLTLENADLSALHIPE